MARSTQPKVNVVVDLPKRERPRNLWAMLLGRARQMPRRGASNAARRPNPFEPAVPPPGVVGDGKPKIPQIAMDAAKAFDMAADQGPEGVVGSPWVGGYGAGYFSAYAEGKEWLGYAVLALLSAPRVPRDDRHLRDGDDPRVDRVQVEERGPRQAAEDQRTEGTPG